MNKLMGISLIILVSLIGIIWFLYVLLNWNLHTNWLIYFSILIIIYILAMYKISIHILRFNNIYREIKFIKNCYNLIYIFLNLSAIVGMIMMMGLFIDFTITIFSIIIFSGILIMIGMIHEDMKIAIDCPYGEIIR